MSNELRAQDLLPREIGLTLLGFEKSEQGWFVRAEGRTRSECPSCGTQSTARHSRYWRQLQDLPVQGKRVALQLRLSRWRCRTRECQQPLFRERPDTILRRIKRRRGIVPATSARSARRWWFGTGGVIDADEIGTCGCFRECAMRFRRIRALRKSLRRPQDAHGNQAQGNQSRNQAFPPRILHGIPPESAQS